jgi:hypothetical protein
MVRFSHDDGKIPFVRVIPNKGLDPGHPGAGGIDDFQSRSLEKLALLRGDSVGADDDRSMLERRNILGHVNPFGLKEVHDLLVVDERSISEDRSGVFVGLSQHRFQGAANSHAEACGLGLLDFQWSSSSSSEK